MQESQMRKRLGSLYLLADSRLARNLSWSMLGTGLPMIVAVFTIPQLIAGLGVPRFGVLTLAWLIVGYFSFFDLGLGRALTQLVARRIGAGREGEVPAIFWCGMVLMSLLGVVGALVLGFVSPWLVKTKLAIPEDLRLETLRTFYLLAASIPVVIAATGLRGFLEGYQRFDVVNTVRIPLGAMTYLAPLAVLPFSTALPDMVIALLVTRVIACGVYFHVCLRLYPALCRRVEFDAAQVRQMLAFGGWMTVSNIVGPLLLYLGRLLLAILVSSEAVAYFSTPYDVVINLLTIPAILLSVFFPMFAQQFAEEPAAVRALYRQAMLFNILAVLPLSVAACLLARPALAWWIGPDFADQSYKVVQFVAAGVLINSVGLIAQSIVQAFGRPDLTAKLHILELIIYVPYVWWLVGNYGVDGASVAWVIRVSVSTVALLLLAQGCFSGKIRGDSKAPGKPGTAIK